MGAFLEGAGAAVEAGTGAFAVGQSAHENAVQYRQDAQTGADARRQNERLMNPPQWPGYSENVQGYTSPGFNMYGSTPQFTDGAPQGNNTQVSTMPVGGSAVLNPDGTVSYPGALESIGNAVMPQQRGYDVGSAFGVQGGPIYFQPQSYAPAFTSAFGLPPVFFTDSAAPAANVAPANKRR